jgi:hypothetical protein
VAISQIHGRRAQRPGGRLPVRGAAPSADHHSLLSRACGNASADLGSLLRLAPGLICDPLAGLAAKPLPRGNLAYSAATS